MLTVELILTAALSLCLPLKYPYHEAKQTVRLSALMQFNMGYLGSPVTSSSQSAWPMRCNLG